MKYADFWKRLGSLLIDALVFSPLIFVYFYVITHFQSLAIFCLIAMAFIGPMYSIYFHCRWGQTIGKMAVGIIVRDLSGRPISWRQAFLRNIVDLIFGIPIAIGSWIAFLRMPEAAYQDPSFLNWAKMFAESQPIFVKPLQNMGSIWTWSEAIVLLFNKKKRALHDFIACTVVVEKSSLSSITDAA